MAVHEFTGRVSNIAVSYATGKPMLTVEADGSVQALFQMFDDLKASEKLSFKVGKFRERRSLDANAYCWTMIGKIAEKTNVPKSDVYRAAIKEIGGNYDIVCMKSEAVDALRDAWSRNGIGWQTEDQRGQRLLGVPDRCAPQSIKSRRTRQTWAQARYEAEARLPAQI